MHDTAILDDLISVAMGRMRIDLDGLLADGARQLTNRQIEHAFQVALCEALNGRSDELGDGWNWCREVRFLTKKTVNAREIVTDIVGWRAEGELVAVELKFVMAARKNGPQGDFPAFPYNVLKDCLKGDLLLSGEIPVSAAGFRRPRHDEGRVPPGRCLPEEARIVDAVSIGLTDCSDYWRSDSARQGLWAANSLAPMRAESFGIGAQVRTVTGEGDGSIFWNERCHLSFSRVWRGSWASLPLAGHKLRYVYLRPFEVRGYGHDPEDPEFVPFLRPSARTAYLARQAAYGLTRPPRTPRTPSTSTKRRSAPGA